EQGLTQSSNAQHPTDWSRDSRFVLYYEVAPDTQRDLWMLPVTREGTPTGAPRIYLRTPFNELLGCFSPNVSPRWVAYMSDESGRYEIYVQAFPEPRGKWQISTGGGTWPQWGKDGRELLYVSADSKLMVVSLAFGADSVKPSAQRVSFALGRDAYAVSADGQR